MSGADASRRLLVGRGEPVKGEREDLLSFDEVGGGE